MSHGVACSIAAQFGHAGLDLLACLGAPSEGVALAIAYVLRAAAYVAASFALTGLMHAANTRVTNRMLTVGTAAGVACYAGGRWLHAGAFASEGSPWVMGAVWVGLTAFQFLLWRYYFFFRDPERRIPAGRTVVSPADGYVLYVRKIEGGCVPIAIKDERRIAVSEFHQTDVGREFDGGWLVGIFMTPVSIHVNRAPIEGAVEQIAHVPGTNRTMARTHLRALVGRRPLERGAVYLTSNERETMLIRGDCPVWVVRIADLGVNHIVTRPKVGQVVDKGERIGMIRMGSQADVILPAAVGASPTVIAVREGQYVYGGETVIATY